MKRQPFSGLSWRLAVSYFLVTVVAALTIEVAGTIQQSFQPTQEPDASRTLPQVLIARTEPIAAYLHGTGQPDQYDMQSLYLNPILDRVGGRTTGLYGVVVLLDPHRHILAAAMTTFRRQSHDGLTVATGPPPVLQHLVDSVPSQAVVQHALAAHESTPLTGSDAQGDSIIAIPVRFGGGPVLGVLATLFDGALHDRPAPPGDLATIWATFLHGLQPADFSFIVLASIIGTLTGMVISRNLGRRLGRITLAAAAWSQGILQVEVNDPSPDELGQLARDLNRMADRLHSLLAARQTLAVLEERNRLARELHDTVKQHVFANALLVRAGRTLYARDPQRAHAVLLEAEELAGQAQQELVSLIRALRPAQLADKGVAAAIQELAGEWSRRVGIAVDVRLQGASATPLDIEEALFRVTQEALTNVARHSRAHCVDIHLAWSPDHLVLAIGDDGKGFDVGHGDGKGGGLRTMRERVEALGGALTVTSSAQGTRLQAAVPFNCCGPHAEAR